MRLFLVLFFTVLLSDAVYSQDDYEKARRNFHENKLDSARFYIQKNLNKKPSAEDYFLSGLIHEAEGMPLRAVADYEAVVRQDPNHLEAYFQKGLIYFSSASAEQAIKDFSYVIDNQATSETKAIYFANDPLGAKGTFATTLQTMMGRVYQYRGMAYQKVGDLKRAMADFDYALTYDSTAEVFVNRSQLFSRAGEDDKAIMDLRHALEIEPDNYLAWYNLAVLDESALLPNQLMENESFTPLLHLMGANAYESQEYLRSAQYFTKSLESNPNDDFALIGRGKARLKTGAYQAARRDFLKAIQINSDRTEAFYLIGNSLFYEKKFEEALGFYNQYLSIDWGHVNVWYNAAMSYLSTRQQERACECLKKAASLGMDMAERMLNEQCDSP